MQTTGGVVGSNNGTVENCYNTGGVSGTSSIGGVGGVVGSNDGVVRNCYNTGTVNGSDYVGGVVGHGFKGSSIKGCYNAGSVNGDDYVGGVIGFNLGELKRCFFDRDVFSGNSVGFSDSEEGFVTVAGMTTDEFKNGTVAYMLGDAFGQNLSEGGDLLPVFRTEDNVVYYDWVQGVYTNHGHVWTYTADGATITATCSNKDGDCSAPVQTVTLVAPVDTVYNGVRKEPDFEGTVDGGVPRLTYTSDATSVGTHTVSMSWGDATASVTFTITPCPHENFTDGVCDHCDHTAPCADGDLDHACDVCNALLAHTDGDDADHLCDYCWCDIGEACYDIRKDHVCDECGATGMGEHKAEAGRHKCGYCARTITKCADTDIDGLCDTCGELLDVEIYVLAGVTAVGYSVADAIANATLDALETAADHVTEEAETLTTAGYNEVIKPAAEALDSILEAINGVFSCVRGWF